MQAYPRFRRNFLAAVLAGNLVPLSLGAAAWFLLDSFSHLPESTLMLLAVAAAVIPGTILALYIFRWLSSRIKLVDQHIESLSQGAYRYRTTADTKGIFGSIFHKLNALGDKLQELVSSSQAQTAVVSAEANRLRNVINSITDGVLALDKDGRIILFNNAASRISGFSIEEAAGKPAAQIVPMLRGDQLILSEWLEAANGAAIERQRWESVRLKTKAGKDRNLDVEALYQGADPNGIRTLVTFHDRTEAQEVEDMKVDFVALAAHELRTPITVIRGYLELLEEELDPKLSDGQKEYFRKLGVASSQLSGFINNILHVSRIEHGNLNLKFEKTDWRTLVKGACDELTKEAEVQDKKLILNLPEALPEVAVDKMSIVEVVNNLVNNAIKYSEPQTTVTVTVRQNEDAIETIIEDHGVGIPENELDKLFTKFYRAHGTRGSHRGTGLGLYMSKGIVEAHGGSIWVHSKEGTGSTFGFLLPMYTAMAGKHEVDSSNKVTRGVHGWIKNHSLYRG